MPAKAHEDPRHSEQREHFFSCFWTRIPPAINAYGYRLSVLLLEIHRLCNVLIVRIVGVCTIIIVHGGIRSRPWQGLCRVAQRGIVLSLMRSIAGCILLAALTYLV